MLGTWYRSALYTFTLCLVTLCVTVKAQNPNCGIIVPPQPLTAQGLATPYQLTTLDPNAGPCNMSNGDQTAFVQGAVIDLDTGQILVYNPLVIDQGSTPAIAPVVPVLPKNNIVAIWFGFNGDTITLIDNQGSLNAGLCVNGIADSVFGQFAYCNAPNFFAAANQAIQQGLLVVPQLGTARDGDPCPTTRDFGLVDQDESDNVNTQYLITADGKTAQNTAANRAALPNAKVLVNPSDNSLLTNFVLPALGCSPWTAPDLADLGHNVPALPLNELLAAVRQQAPIAIVPANDPMVLDNNGQVNLQKLNAYRRGVNQPPANTINDASPTAYCRDLVQTGGARLLKDSLLFGNFISPDPAAGNLLLFLTQRWGSAYNILGCPNLLNTGDIVAAAQNVGCVCANAVNNPTGTQTPVAQTPAPNDSTKIIPGYALAIAVGLVMLHNF